MSAKTKQRLIYGATFLLLFAVEVCIALFVKDKFIRPYVGDILVIPLLCCLFRIAVPSRPRLLGLYAVILGITAEVMQLCRIDELLGVEGTVIGIILGSTFDIKDILCYLIGGAIFLAFDQSIRKIVKS